ncbi:hypothetical protein CEXT_717261 [Caerostris extrusa]|uniref:Uncharacterized protein n=1 Tax=Caerostris extrusa TaxID=172846 RepID=A0AAV4Y654_CAEEX|nr:hypothetical protein CEXT_717261 [Caerostris extrusa]
MNVYSAVPAPVPKPDYSSFQSISVDSSKCQTNNRLIIRQLSQIFFNSQRDMSISPQDSLSTDLACLHNFLPTAAFKSAIKIKTSCFGIDFFFAVCDRTETFILSTEAFVEASTCMIAIWMYLEKKVIIIIIWFTGSHLLILLEAVCQEEKNELNYSERLKEAIGKTL